MTQSMGLGEWPGPYWAEPLRTENAWRVRRAFDGQNVLFRVTKEKAKEFAAEMNAKALASALPGAVKERG